MAGLVSLTFFLSSLAGVLAVLFSKRISDKFIKLVLAFSGAYLLAISLLSLLPELFEQGGHSVSVFILGGFFLQLTLDYVSQGIEHGHVHHHAHHGTHTHERGHGAFPWLLMVSLCVHGFLEGMPIEGVHHDHLTHRDQQLILGIVLHNIPLSFTLVTLLLASGRSNKVIFFSLLIFAVMTPAGTLVSYMLSGNLLEGISAYYNNILAFVLGIFMHISTTILFETSEHHRFNLIKYISILAGAVLALLFR